MRPTLLPLALLAAPVLAAEGPQTAAWLEIKSPAARITVVTDAGDKPGRKAAFQLIQVDRVLAKRFPWLRPEDEAPLLVFASGDESLVRSISPESTDADGGVATYLAATPLNVGAVRTDLADPADKDRGLHRGLHRGRVTSMLDRVFGKSAPPWLARGLVTFLADTVVRDKDVLTGRMTLATGENVPVPSPSAMEFFKEGRATDRRFDLQAGYFVQYLLSADNGKNAAALDTLLAKLAARESGPAVQAALAKVTALYAGFPKYLGGKKFPPLKLGLDPAVTQVGLAVRPMPVAEALMLRAELFFDQNRPVDARGLLRQVKEADPTLARPLEIEAVLYEREQRTAESRQAIEAAIQLGSKNGSLYYRLAQLQWARTMTKPALQSVATLLETARDLSPGDVAVLAYLAEIQGDLGRAAPALESAQRAATAAPGDLYAQMALARAQWNARQTDAGIATAQKALPLAKLASQKQRVQDFINFTTMNRRAQANGSKPWTSQFGPPPAGAFGVTRATGGVGGGNRVSAGQARIDSGDASAIADCFANRNDAACSRAVPSLEASCAEKQTTSCVSLGSLYEGGFGVTRDRRKAASFYKTACDLSDKAGCARYAFLEAMGLGVAQNEARAMKTLESLCAAKVPEGCIGLAQVLRTTGFAVDRERANGLLKTTCDAGSAEACGLLSGR